MISFFLVLGFSKTGQVDEEIGWVLGPAGGILVLILNQFWPGGYGGLVWHAVVAFGLLTLCRIVRGRTERRDPEE